MKFVYVVKEFKSQERERKTHMCQIYIEKVEKL